MAYYEESTFLDLSKEIYNMDYQSLVPEAEVETHREEGEEKEKENKVDFSTNAYLFFKEKNIIRRDMLNLCRYIELVYLQGEASDPRLQNFPYTQLHTRVNQILQKYHEQPALLDKTAKFIILQSMETIKNVCRRYMESHGHALKHGLELPKFPMITCELLKTLNFLISIRGVERVVRHFPHEARDFEPVIFTLTSRLP